MTGAIFRPETAADVVDAIRDGQGPLAIEGGGGLKGLGRPIQAAATLKLDRLTGVVEYSPTELYVTFQAGTPLADARQALAEKRQRLPFDPPDLTRLYQGGGADGPATIGGVVAAALSGPARVALGAARDYLIGANFVDGSGNPIRGGGKVMKNVTGYDLCKLTTGAFGSLGAITATTFKVLPVAPAEVTLALVGLDDAAGQAALSAAFRSPFEPLGAAHLPADIARLIDAAPGEDALTLVRLEGFPESLAYREQAIRAYLPKQADILVLKDEASAALWAAIRDVAPFQAPDDRPLWRLSTAPTAGPALTAKLKSALGGSAYFDWAGGLIWFAPPTGAADAGAAIVRPAAHAAGGHATLMRAPEATRAAVDVFEPLSAPILKLTSGLKAQFDPKGRLNPGRMYAGV